MPTVNNIFNIKILRVEDNGSVNFGNAIHKGHTTNDKSIGGFFGVGDGSLNISPTLNKVNDPDFIDQPSSQI